MVDNKVKHPKHYNDKKMECWDWMELGMSKEEYKGFLLGNVYKYLYRYNSKNGKEDLDKAKNYIDKMVEVL